MPLLLEFDAAAIVLRVTHGQMSQAGNLLNAANVDAVLAFPAALRIVQI